jgi:hypothetical protein
MIIDHQERSVQRAALAWSLSARRSKTPENWLKCAISPGSEGAITANTTPKRRLTAVR